MPAATLSPRRRFYRKLALDLAIMAAIGVLMALIGPFGTFAQPLAPRLLTWLAYAFAGYALYRPIGWAVGRLHEHLALPNGALWVVAVLVATVPMTAVVWGLPRAHRWPRLDEALTLYGQVLVLGGAVSALLLALSHGRANSTGIAEAAPAAAPHPRFLDRLPPRLGTRLIALEMEDHYVRAHTALGSDLVLLRLRDAVIELEGMEGMQVHRSWWVARDAIEDARRDGRNLRLVLTGGLEAPVSRANVAALKEAGWV